MKSCSVQELKALRQNSPQLFLLDCRTPQEFEVGHVPGAILCPLGSDLETFSWPKDQTLYIICYSGARSMAFCQELKALGREGVNVEGGTQAWLEEGYEIER